MGGEHHSAEAALAKLLLSRVLVDALVEEALSAQNLLMPELLGLLAIEIDEPLLF